MSGNGSANPEELFYCKLAARLSADPFGLALWGKDRIETLWKAGEFVPPERSVIEEPELRVAGYLDLSPGLLIVDSGLGSLGLVYRLNDNFEELTHTIIDQATYLRHLLIMDAGADARPARRPYTVECVLSFASQDVEQTLKEVFRNTARDTAFWHAIGVHVLMCADVDQISDARMSRAFSWLLSSTRVWFKDSSPAPPVKVLSSISLTNYRLAGRRSLTLQPNVPVHLVYGQNGVGKSSIAEALELSVTGSVARLKAKTVADYAAVIRNRHTDQPAKIQLQFNTPPPWESQVVAQGVNFPLNPGIPASSFRLDQDAMDTLAREGSEKRAEIFLRSFFPEDTGVHIALDAARESLNNILQTLPPEIQSSLGTGTAEQQANAVQARFGWLDEARPPTREECRDCEPLSQEALELLRVFNPEIGVYLDTSEFRDLPHFDKVFKDLNEALERIRVRAAVLVEAIRTSRHSLSEERVVNWSSANASGSAHDWSALLERWTRQIALADLAEKHWQIVKTLSEARAGGPESLDLPDAGLFGQTEQALSNILDGLEKLRTDSAGEREKLELQVVEFSRSSLEPSAKSGEQPHLTDRQIRALNLAGETLTPPGALSGSASPAQQLGTTMDQAFTQDKPSTFAEVVIGSTGWAGALSVKLEKVAKALATMVNEGDQIETRSQSTASYVGPLQRKDTLKAALDASKAVKEAAKKTQTAFLTELRNKSFNDALNELMALFTPARWAYDDIEIKRSSARGKENLELGISGAKDSQADLLLNTAELNVFTVALYLLAATRVANPLGILIFDDPLQNMDELTVTTLARGLAKVLPLFPPKWQLVFLFHGEDDLERFRQEVPAAVYLLPWLAPSAALGDDPPVSAEPLKSTFGSELQSLSSIIKARNP